MLSAILRDTPKSVTDLRADLPKEFARIIRQCLQKDPEERYQTAKDLRNQLRALKADLNSGDIAPIDAGNRPPASGRHSRRAWVAIGATLALAGAVGAYTLFRPAPESPIPFKGGTARKLTTHGRAYFAAISPDAKYVAYVLMDESGKRIVLTQIATAIDRTLWGPHPQDIRYPGFSTGGDYLYFVSRERQGDASRLYQVSVQGGEPRQVLDRVDSPVTFAPDGSRLAFIRNDVDKGETALVTANADGSHVKVLATRRSPQSFGPDRPAWSPDGRVIVTTAWESASSFCDLVAVSVKDGTVTPLTSDRWTAIGEVAWLPDGGGLLMEANPRSGTQMQIWSVPAKGGPARRVTNDPNTYYGVSLSRDGSTLATVKVEAQSDIWVSQNGDPRTAMAVTSGKNLGFGGIAWARDGRIVYGTIDLDLWVMDADGSHQRLLTGDARGVSAHPSVSSDGRSVFFCSWPRDAAGLARVGIDGGPVTIVTDPSGETAPRCSSDGKWVMYQDGGNRNEPIWLVGPDGGTKRSWPGKVTFSPAISPDGRRVAGFYRDPVSSRVVLTITPFEGGEPEKMFDLPPKAIPFSDSLIPDLRWTPDARALAYVAGTLRAQGIWTQPIEGGAPRPLPAFKDDAIVWSFDWSGDGRLAWVRGSANLDVVLITREEKK